MFALVICWKLIEKTIGFGFVINLWRLNKLKKNGWIVLKIHTVSGRPVYRIVKDDKLIYYDWIENGEIKRKLVISLRESFLRSWFNNLRFNRYNIFNFFFITLFIFIYHVLCEFLNKLPERIPFRFSFLFYLFSRNYIFSCRD